MKKFNKPKNIYYVVHKGEKPGIYSTWNECKKNVDNFEGAIFKKFENEKEAIQFLQSGFGNYKKKEKVDLPEKKSISETLDKDSIYIYTDGSCIKMKNKIVIAGYGIYIPSKNISIALPLLNQKITNNRAELSAIIESINYLNDEEINNNIIKIVTDSQYSMYLFHGTGERYEKNGYKQDGKGVPNIDLIKKLLEIKRKYNIDLIKVRAHTGKKDVHSLNNEIADKLANEGAFMSIKEKSEDNILSIINSDYDKLMKSGYKEKDVFSFVDNPVCLDNIFSEARKEKIDKDIHMNELFEFDQLEDEVPKLKVTKKTLKLNNWFIRSTK
jgi:ribonuclease HI